MHRDTAKITWINMDNEVRQRGTMCGNLGDYRIEILFFFLMESCLHREPKEKQYLWIQSKRRPIFLKHL
jgi:hypothetical protein